MSDSWITLESALFLDFDGTLADLADSPGAVVVEPDLPLVLEALSSRLSGALAIVSGRPIAEIDHFLSPLRVPVAGVHGLERRSASGEMHYAPVENLLPVQQAMAKLVERYPLLLMEQKRGALALHYRALPEVGPECHAVIAQAASACPGTVVLQGKMVVEVKSAFASKATAIRAYLSEAPFCGRRPVFAGDDVTDEAGFSFAQEVQGLGIKIGPGATAASRRVPSAAEFREILRSTARSLLDAS